MNSKAPLNEAVAVLRPPEAAAYTGISEGKLAKMRMAGGDGPVFIRLTTRSVGYLRKDLDAYLEARRVRSTSAQFGQAA